MSSISIEIVRNRWYEINYKIKEIKNILTISYFSFGKNSFKNEFYRFKTKNQKYIQYGKDLSELTDQELIEKKRTIEARNVVNAIIPGSIGWNFYL